MRFSTRQWINDPALRQIRRQDLLLFARQAVTFGRLVTYLLWLGIVYAAFAHRDAVWPPLPLFATGGMLFALGGAYRDSVRKRFANQRFASLWSGCQDRLVRFEAVLKKTKRSGIADLEEMPNTIRNVSRSLYRALRRADLIASEIAATESEMVNGPPAWNSRTDDPQSMELYRIADRNIAEYRTRFAEVLSGVRRTEAQSAVFMTTLDALRMKLLGYRLIGSSPELPSAEFLTDIAEAHLQLETIDKALDELDLGHYPKTISVVELGQNLGDTPKG